jgi:hypothetical protein
MLQDDPIKWTCLQLEQLPTEELHLLARRASGVLVQSRLLIGRCLVAIDRTKLFEEFGCSGTVHYAGLYLGLESKEAQELRRVASQLEGLPLLTEAAENGTIEWCALREVTRKATPDTEAYWLDAARTCTMRRLERLLRQAGDKEERGAKTVELRMILEPEVAAMFHQTLRELSQEAGRRLSSSETLEYLCAERGAGPREAARDVAAEEAAPWAAVAAEETPCPGVPDLQLVARAVPHWSNDRLQFNPENRLATPAQRREMLRRDGYSCSTPGCPNILWLQVHHIVYFHRGGATVPENMLSVCSKCHKHIHRGHLRVSGQAPHALEWRDREGRRLGQFVALEPADWLRIWLDSG